MRKDIVQEKMRDTVQLIEKLKPQMAAALPKHLDPQKMARVALTQIRQTPKLLDCDPQSLMKCMMISSQLGLEPGPLGHVYFIPYGREAQFIIGYKGMIDLVKRSGQVKAIEAKVIHEHDICEVQLGTNAFINHTMSFGGERGNPIGYYAVAYFTDGGYQFEVMTKAEIERVRASSKAGNSGPWVSHFDEMAKKTVIRRLFKYLPVSTELSQAITMDELADVGKQKGLIDAEFFEFDEETGEVEEPKAKQSEKLADKLSTK